MAFDHYFDQRSDRFSAYYGNERLTRALGRGALFDRLRFAVATAIGIDAKKALDIGCGSGPLFEPLASRNIAVTGLEPAAAMLERARAEAARFPGLVNVESGTWETLDPVDEYDLAVALGIFDYVDAPADLMSRMARAAPSVVASFPSPGLRTEFRKVRYRRGGVNVHGYSREDILALAGGAGLRAAEVAPLGRAGYVVHLVRSDGADRN